jgi:hypothetical protein
VNTETLALARRLAARAERSARADRADHVVLLDYVRALTEEESCRWILEEFDSSRSVEREDPVTAEATSSGNQFAAAVDQAVRYLQNFPDLGAAADAINHVRGTSAELSELRPASAEGLSEALGARALRSPSGAVALVLSRCLAHGTVSAVDILAAILRFEHDAGDGPLTRAGVLEHTQRRFDSRQA